MSKPRNDRVRRRAFSCALSPALLFSALCAAQGREGGGAESPTEAQRNNSSREVAARVEMQSARADVAPLGAGHARGTVEFFVAPDATAVHVMLTGLEPGPHGLHLHERGECGQDGAASGAHFNPTGAPHGAPGDAVEDRHAGDLGNVLAGEDGTVDQWLQHRELRLDGELGVVGKAVIVHKRADDLKSQPAGESGDPIACAAILPIVKERG